MSREEDLIISAALANEIIFDESDIHLNMYNSQMHFQTLLNLLIFWTTRLHSMNPKIFMFEMWIDRYDEHMFFRMFRLTKKSFNILTEVIGRADIKNILTKKYTGGHYPLDLKSQLLISLWYLATGDTLLSIGGRFNVSPTTVMNVNNRIIYFLLQLKKKYIIFPSHQELHTVAQGFHHYPGAIGAIDGTHIFVKVEKAQQDSYIDRYRRHSINLMAICDGNCFFTYIFAGFPGSAHDSRVFQNSSFYRQIEAHGSQKFFDDNFHLIGDSAFGLKTWLMTPYKGINITRIQKKHNYMLSADRVKIEHAFGLLKGRWRRLQYINVYNICKAVEIITACCVLHNFCLVIKDLWDEEAPIDHADRQANHQEEDQQEGRLKRDLIAAHFQ